VHDRRRQQRRIADRRRVDEDGAVTQLRAELGRGGEREPRLARPARAGERDQPHVLTPQQACDGRHREPPADERRRRRRQVHASSFRRRGCGQRRVVTEDLTFEFLQLGAWVDAELVHQGVACRSVGLERLLLPPGAVEREHVLRAEALAVGLRGDQLVQLRHELLVLPQRELRVVQELVGGKPTVLEARGFRLRHGLAAEVRQRRAAPERERRPHVVGGIGRPALGKRSAPVVEEPLEARQVELALLHRQPVAAPVRLDPLAPERLAQAVDVDLERLH
jgi:hypothetical protein